MPIIKRADSRILTHIQTLSATRIYIVDNEEAEIERGWLSRTEGKERFYLQFVYETNREMPNVL